jgi:CheY-like chemotaxis protein
MEEPAPLLVAGLDARSLLLEAPVLLRDGHAVEESASGRDLLVRLANGGSRLVVLGPRLPDLALPELIREIRASPATRRVSLLALIPAGEPPSLDGSAVEAGVNAILRRPLDTARLESWIAKLLVVPRRVETRVQVHGQVVGTPHGTAGHFVGLTRNLSIHGMLLASPVRLAAEPDLDLECNNPTLSLRFTALGRVVRQAPEVTWPYLGYGVEFLVVPPVSRKAIEDLVTRDAPEAPGTSTSQETIHSTVRTGEWIYELLEPLKGSAGWMVEIRRCPRDGWRPGAGGPFYVVEGASADRALSEARAFLRRHG